MAEHHKTKKARKRNHACGFLCGKTSINLADMSLHENVCCHKPVGHCGDGATTRDGAPGRERGATDSSHEAASMDATGPTNSMRGARVAEDEPPSTSTRMGTAHSQQDEPKLCVFDDVTCSRLGIAPVFGKTSRALVGYSCRVCARSGSAVKGKGSEAKNNEFHFSCYGSIGAARHKSTLQQSVMKHMLGNKAHQENVKIVAARGGLSPRGGETRALFVDTSSFFFFFHKKRQQRPRGNPQSRAGDWATSGGVVTGLWGEMVRNIGCLRLHLGG